ncbi:MAG: PhzF family phenazine biosynthesis protein [Reyranella sp.]|uniref:PhzF family phenazine biosynthesis protein n=1 Tax=Reyranella sp. TaxID=1929291 RepID=UPI0011FD4F72|nr:PhzF family phenazine biosynthesis protein [Reyranella sp.]TAJ40824.1 MAG: PhzF family phenazine biosynthesis protein [Reyranella sp.]
MKTYEYVTVDVFTDRRFGGNPLAVFPDAQGLSDGEMQSLATEFNLSETTFVLPPADPANTARVRIFNRSAEMPFAGHPNVGTGWVLAGRGRAKEGVLRFEEIAGLVEVKVESDIVTIAAPQPLTLGPEMPAGLLAGCVGLAPEEILLATHRPVMASVGNSFVVAEVTPDGLTRAAPDLARFRDAHAAFPALGPRRLPLYLYAHDGQAKNKTRLRARMFSPLSGTVEDAATGSAATPLAALLLSLTDEQARRYDIVQGVEMGRPSLLRASAHRAADGIRAAVGGGCVPVLKGEVSL